MVVAGHGDGIFFETGRPHWFALLLCFIRLQDNWIFQEKLCRHRAVMNLFDQRPKLAAGTFVAPNASVIGSVEINNCSSVWCARLQ